MYGRGWFHQIANVPADWRLQVRKQKLHSYAIVAGIHIVKNNFWAVEYVSTLGKRLQSGFY